MMHNHKMMIWLFVVFSIVNCLFVKQVDSASRCGDKMLNPQVYALKWSKLSKLIMSTGNNGFIDDEMKRSFWFDISKNNDGTSIRILNRYRKELIIFSCDGSFKLIKLPSFYSWIDNNDNILAWAEKESDLHSTTKYIKGTPPVEVDPSGQYFIKNVNKNNGAVYSVANPDVPLVRLKIISSDGLLLFQKKENLYVFGFDKIGLTSPLKCFIYKKNGKEFSLEEEIEIPRPRKNVETPYVVEDMSPWGDEVLLVDFYDFSPFHKRYIFNLKTKKLEYYGLVTKEKCLFLQYDVLDAVQEKGL